MTGAGASGAVSRSWLPRPQGAFTILGRAMGSIREGSRVPAETVEALVRCLRGWFGEGDERWAVLSWRGARIEHRTNPESGRRQSFRHLDVDWYDENQSQGNSEFAAGATDDVTSVFGATNPCWPKGPSDVTDPAFESHLRRTAITAQRHCRRHVVAQGGRG